MKPVKESVAPKQFRRSEVGNSPKLSQMDVGTEVGDELGEKIRQGLQASFYYYFISFAFFDCDQARAKGGGSGSEMGLSREPVKVLLWLDMWNRDQRLSASSTWGATEGGYQPKSPGPQQRSPGPVACPVQSIASSPHQPRRAAQLWTRVAPCLWLN